MTETAGQEKTKRKGREMFGGECLTFCLIDTWLHKQQREREADLRLQSCPLNVLTIQHFHIQDRIPLQLSFTPAQLIGLILASVSLKAECICPKATPKGRKDNTSKNRRHNWEPTSKRFSGPERLSGVCPPSQRRWRVSRWPRFCLCCWIFFS